jgi:phosphoglycolate phosphatase
MSVPTHVLLDLDGTISDSSPGITRSLQHAFTACGFDPPSDDDVRKVIGPPFEESFPQLGVPVSEIERVVAVYRERYEDVGLFENTLYPGVTGMLDDLAAAGHVLSVATAKPEPTAVRIVEHFGLTDRFAVQVGATVEVGSHRRTKAEVIAEALVRIGATDGVAAPAAVMVGDRDHDVAGATANGIGCIGVTWGFGTEQELRDAGVTALVDSPAGVAGAIAATYRSGRP